MTTYSPEKKITVLKHLVTGKTPEVVATITRLDRYEVIDLASNHGYPDVDKMAKAVELLTARLEKDRQDDLPAATRTSSPVEPVRPRAVPAPQAAPTPNPTSSKPDDIRVLLDAAKGHPSKRIQAAADRVFDQLDRVRDLMREDQAKHAAKRREQAAKEAARVEVKRLEQQLAAAKAKLRGTPTSSTPPDDSVPAATVRVWARDHDVECPATGKVPNAVRHAYNQAHQQAAS